MNQIKTKFNRLIRCTTQAIFYRAVCLQFDKIQYLLYFLIVSGLWYLNYLLCNNNNVQLFIFCYLIIRIFKHTDSIGDTLLTKIKMKFHFDEIRKSF